MILYNRWNIVLVPFPFTDFSNYKKRPALVISPDVYNSSGDLIISFITSNLAFPGKSGDYLITDWNKAGLPKPSLIRMKFATIDSSIIIKSIGNLTQNDIDGFQDSFNKFFQ